MLAEILPALAAMAFALGYGACGALWMNLHRTADVLLTSALGIAGSMLLVSVASAFAIP